MVLEESRPSPSFTRVPSCVVLVNILPGVKSESHAVSLQRISGNYHDFLEVVGLLSSELKVCSRGMWYAPGQEDFPFHFSTLGKGMDATGEALGIAV